MGEEVKPLEWNTLEELNDMDITIEEQETGSLEEAAADDTAPGFFQADDLVKGIILAEILGKPKGRRF